MRTIEQLRSDFALYIVEIERCENANCYWALLHVLLAIPDVCATLEAAPASAKGTVGDRYVKWCKAYFPKSRTMSGKDRYQMRNLLLHSGSTTAQKFYKKHQTAYAYFSYVDPETFDVSVHGTPNQSQSILNVQPTALATETKHALEKWFSVLQGDPIKMAFVERNIKRLTRLQPKRILGTKSNGSQIEIEGLTRSST